MNLKDIIKIKNKEGVEEQVELILTANLNNKKYLLYKDNNNEIYASYITKEDDILHNDLTDEEYNMLEKLYRKGNEIYDK